MKYTYEISGHANSELFAGLKKDIEQLYPQFLFEKDIKDADGSCTAFFKCGRTGECIAAELSYENNSIAVTSDIPLTELSKNTELPNKKQNIMTSDRCLMLCLAPL